MGEWQLSIVPSCPGPSFPHRSFIALELDRTPPNLSVPTLDSQVSYLHPNSVVLRGWKLPKSRSLDLSLLWISRFVGDGHCHSFT